LTGWSGRYRVLGKRETHNDGNAGENEGLSMKKAIAVLSLAVLWPVAASWAQVLAPNKNGVAMGSWYTIVRDVEATKKFWMLLGGAPIKIDGTDVIKFPGVLVFLTPGSPLGDSSGAVIDHVGLTILNAEEFLAKLKAAGVSFPPPSRTPANRANRLPRNEPEYVGRERGVVTTPDGLRVELKGTFYDLSLRTPLGFSPTDWINIPVASDHFESTKPTSALVEVQSWYVKVLGGTPLREYNSGLNYSVDWPGARLRLSERNEPRTFAPTRGQTLDHLGFEVKNLAAYCKKLEAMGVKFDKPYSKSRHASFASAELTDPWGASFELTEGLNKF
jgi:catechol 2,3-dioxygenase-like lactoylglutathione lyase family enzyme